MAAPQIPFISIPFKRTDDIDWIEPLKRYIAHHYQDDPEKYTQETYTLNRLRQDIRGAGKDNTGRDLLYRYYGQLELLDLRFPIDEKHVKILFTWYDAFSGKGTSQYSLAYEKASVLFNFATTLSSIASVQNRSEPDGRKKAFHFLQASAGMFEYINDNFLHAPSLDLSKETVHILAELMLAQAQECIVENSIREKKKDGLITKLASHVVWVYGNLIDDVSESMNQKGLIIDKSWLSMLQIKHKYYQALSQYYKATQCEQESHYGEQVARFTVAEQVSKEASGKLATQFLQQLSTSSSMLPLFNGTIPSDSGHVMQELCKSLAATCHEKLTSATRDNDLIYHDQVPQESILQPIDRLKAVQALSMSDLYNANEMTKIIGSDLFTKLIPLSVHQSASLYSEEQAKLVRSEAEKCDLTKAELRTCLDYMKLPHSLNKFKWYGSHKKEEDIEKNKQLAQWMLPPDDLFTWAHAIYQEEHDQQKNINYLMDTLESLKSKIRSSLDDIQLKMDQEMHECETMRIKYGEKWSQPPSGSLTNHFRQDLKNHRQSIESGAQSDSQLYHQYTEIKKEIDVLRLGSKNEQLNITFIHSLNTINENSNKKEPIEKKKETDIDSLLDLMDDTNTEDPEKKKKEEELLLCQEKVQKIEAMIDKLYKLEKDRYETLEDLKERIKQDDISQLLILNKKSTTEQQIFDSELEKYRPHQQRIQTTIHQQKQMIQELTSIFKALMEGDEAKALQTKWDKMERQKKKLVDQYKYAKDSYFDIQEGLCKGIQFYTSLNEVVQSLSSNCRGFIQDRDIERKRLVEDLNQNQSNNEQALLKEKLNMYQQPLTPLSTSSVSPSVSTSLASAPDISLLSQQTQHLSLHPNNDSSRSTKPIDYSSLSFSQGVTPNPSLQSSIAPPSFYNNNNNNNNNNPPPIPAKEYPTQLPMTTPSYSSSGYQQSPHLPPTFQQPLQNNINTNMVRPLPNNNYYQQPIPSNDQNQYQHYPSQQPSYQSYQQQPQYQPQQQYHQQPQQQYQQQPQQQYQQQQQPQQQYQQQQYQPQQYQPQQPQPQYQPPQQYQQQQPQQSQPYWNNNNTSLLD